MLPSHNDHGRVLVHRARALREGYTYARLTLRANAFDAVERFIPGSTNVDFSRGLRTGIERLRSGLPTSLIVEDAGFEVHSGGRVDREERIELPESFKAST
jgi:hypothetical protein